MEEYSSYHNLGNGYYMRRTEWFICGNPVKAKEKHFRPDGRCVYVKEYTSDGKVTYEEWRNWWENGELKGLYNSEGFKQEFTWDGLPIKGR